MWTTAFWEKVKRVTPSERKAEAGVLAILTRRLKAGIAEIAAVKSSQQFRREEEKDR
jgi:hypothetical protein